MCEFVHLNVKTEYSILNSIAKTDQIIDWAIQQKMPAIAISDMNNLYNVFHFEQKCKKKGINPILSVTFNVNWSQSDVNPEYGNVTLIAKNSTGYSNLIALSTLANTGDRLKSKDSFAHLRRADFNNHTDGLICLSGGTSGIFFRRWLLKKDLTKPLEFLIKHFDSESLYFEFQNHFLQEEEDFLKDPSVKQLLSAYHIPVVATNDVHYLKKAHAEYRDMAVSMNANPQGLNESSDMVKNGSEWYLKTPDEMKEAFSNYLEDYPDLLSNTVRIANLSQAEVHIEKALPEFPIPDGFSPISYLRKLAYEGFESSFPNLNEKRQKYLDRLEYELSVIEEMGFVDYHLITADFIQWAKDSRVYEHPERYFPKERYDHSKIPDKILNKDYEIMVGPGRGSAAGSLLCRCLSITDLDPVADGLLFERFLNKERVSMPDIDTDFANYGRYEVIEYCQAKYGYDRVCQIATFQTLGVKSIIKTVGKHLGLNFERTNEMTSKVPEKIVVKKKNGSGQVIEETKTVQLLSDIEDLPYFSAQIANDEIIEQLFQAGKILEGLPSSVGKHAAGVIIGRQPLDTLLPLMEVDGVMVSQFEKKAAESVGMLKMDFLGLQTLDILHETLRLIQEVHHVSIKLDQIPRNDPKTFEQIFQSGKTSNVFQFESEGMKDLLRRMRPVCLMDLCLANAAYRPGPLQFIDEFVKGRNNPASVVYPCKEYEDVASETNAILFYQEQIMQIVQKMAGFSLGQADILRRGIGKKEKKYIDEGRERFIAGCLAMNTADEKLACQIYSNIERFANYGFNKSHSDAYGYLAYLCGWLKAHYPICFMAANATVLADNPNKLLHTLKEIQRMNIPLLAPNIRSSKPEFSLEKTSNGQYGIRFGLKAIRSISAESAQICYLAKDKSSLFRFLLSTPSAMKKSQIQSLIHSGAMDWFGSRKSLISQYEEMNEAVKLCRQSAAMGMGNVLIGMNPMHKNKQEEYTVIEKVVLEKKAISIALSSHPITPYRQILNQKKHLFEVIEQFKHLEENTQMDDVSLPVQVFAAVQSVKRLKTKKGSDMAFVVINDEESELDCVLFPKVLDSIPEFDLLHPYIILGNLKRSKTGNLSLIVEDMNPVEIHSSLYIRKRSLNEMVLNEMKAVNGILPVFVIDDLHPFSDQAIHRLPFSTDLTPFIRRMVKNGEIIVKK